VQFGLRRQITEDSLTQGLNSVSAVLFFPGFEFLVIATFGFNHFTVLGFLYSLDLARRAWCQLKFCWFYRPSSAFIGIKKWQQRLSMTWFGIAPYKRT